MGNEVTLLPIDDVLDVAANLAIFFWSDRAHPNPSVKHTFCFQRNMWNIDYFKCTVYEAGGTKQDEVVLQIGNYIAFETMDAILIVFSFVSDCDHALLQRVSISKDLE